MVVASVACMTTGAPGASARLRAVVDDLLVEPWWQRTGAGLREDAAELERQVARLDAARLRLLAEADARRVGTAAGAPSTAAWLSAEARLRPQRAAERVALAGALAGPLAVTGAALAAGDLSLDHAGVVCRTVTAIGTGVDAATLQEAEAFLVEHAAHLDPRELAVVGRQLQVRLQRDAQERLAREEDAAVTRRELRLTQDDQGVWHLSGTLDAVSGATVAAALDDLSAPLPAVDGVRDRRGATQRRGEALVQLADEHLATGGGAASSRPRLVVTVPVETVLEPGAPGAAPGTLTGGHPASVAALEELSCDAEVVPVLLDPRGVPLDVGRTVYAFPERIRRAILLRDGGCSYRGCRRPASWCRIHHLVAWSDGGSTSERNGTALCGFHHRLVHRRGWRGESPASGRCPQVGAQVVWHPPDRDAPEVPPPPWLPAMQRLVERWRLRAA